MAEERDFVMARLAAAQGHLEGAREAISECIMHFIFPEEDSNGKKRYEALEMAAECAGQLSRSVEAAQTVLEELGKDQLSEEEPDLPEGDGHDPEESSED